jgi:signal transduction histidine kinase
MIGHTNSRLIYDLVDSIIIFDSQNSVVFKGSEINDILTAAGIDPAVFCLNESKANQNSKLICQTVSEVRNSLSPKSFTIPKVDHQFVAFPVNLKDKTEIILALHDKVMHINAIEHDLAERAKELECLYNITRELDTLKPLEDVFDDIANIIKFAFQFPSSTRVVISIENKVFGYRDYLPDNQYKVMEAKLYTQDEEHGTLKVYLENEYDFLMEESHLLREVAGKISRAVQKRKERLNLEKQQRILRLKNDKLLQLTEECSERRQKLRTFFNAISDPIVVVDRDFNISMSNKDEIGESGKCYNKLFNRSERCEVCPTMQTFETSKNGVHELEDNGFTYILRSFPIFDDEGKVESVLEVCRDVTDRKIMETQLNQTSKLASLGKLVAGVAHEINNPNTFILGNMKIVSEAYEDIFPILDEYYKNNPELKIARLPYELFKDNIKVLVGDMINGAKRTKKIVGDLRNFAKKDEGDLNEKVDLNHIINNHLVLTQKHIKKRAKLEIDLDDDLPVFIGNNQKMEQVLINLSINASEAIKHDNGLVIIATRYDKNSNEIKLIITDNGSGMDETTRKQLFDPFFTTKRDKGGTGLGLSITYGIIEEHGGHIDVESVIDDGTTFTVKIPAKREIENEKNSPN